MSDKSSIQHRFLESIEDVPQDDWNRMVDQNVPFLRHEFLSALEQSGSVGAESGWQPKHYVLTDAQDNLIGAAPLYLKDHSYGEYVFDWAWAEAYQRYGYQYYPKLVCAIPFTPCQGPRFLVNQNHSESSEDAGSIFDELESRFISDTLEFCRSESLSSFHLLFPSKETENTNTEIQERLGIQYHWSNRDYQSFDHYLDTFTSRKRKTIKKERKAVAEKQLGFRWLDGKEVGSEDLKHFYSLYVSTYFKRGQSPYLNLAFFTSLVSSMPEDMVFLFVYDNEKIVAGALFFRGTRTLYGRYWGCLKEYDLLHFETCYYQGIEYCIKHGLSAFDAGAQGEHKLLRGFEPIYTRSYHALFEPAFSSAIQRFLAEEKEYLSQAMVQAQAALPFKNTGDSG